MGGILIAANSGNSYRHVPLLFVAVIIGCALQVGANRM